MNDSPVLRGVGRMHSAIDPLQGEGIVFDPGVMNSDHEVGSYHRKSANKSAAMAGAFIRVDGHFGCASSSVGMRTAWAQSFGAGCPRRCWFVWRGKIVAVQVVT